MVVMVRERGGAAHDRDEALVDSSCIHAVVRTDEEHVDEDTVIWR